MACVGGPGRLGRASVGDSLRCSATRGADLLCRFEAFTGAMEGAPSVPTEARLPLTQVLHKNAVTLALRVEACRATTCPRPQEGALGAVWGVLLRNIRIYGFTPLPPPPTHRPGHAASTNQTEIKTAARPAPRGHTLIRSESIERMQRRASSKSKNRELRAEIGSKSHVRLAPMCV